MVIEQKAAQKYERWRLAGSGEVRLGKRDFGGGRARYEASEDGGPHPAKFMDVNMLAMTEGGCERTERQYADLLQKAGLRLVKIHPTPSPVSIVEAAHE